MGFFALKKICSLSSYSARFPKMASSARLSSEIFQLGSARLMKIQLELITKKYALKCVAQKELEEVSIKN